MNSWGYISAGLGSGIAGGIAYGMVGIYEALWLPALVLLVAAGVLTLIGAIAEGVRVGTREAHDEQLIAAFPPARQPVAAFPPPTVG
jgi:uncharacterized membrane protein